MASRLPGPDEILVTGVEYHDGTLWRLYVNNRWMWKYILVDRETAQQVWKLIGLEGSLIVPAPAPSNLTINQVPVEGRWNDREGEKASWERTRDGLEGESGR